MFVPDSSACVAPAEQPIPQAELNLSQSIMAALSRLFDGAIASYNAGRVEPPGAFQDLGVNVQKDVEQTNRSGAGGPAAFLTGGAWTASASPSAAADPVTVVPLEGTVHMAPQPLRLTTEQGVDVPVAPGRGGQTGFLMMTPSGPIRTNGGRGYSTVSPDSVRFGCPRAAGLSGALSVTPYGVNCTPAEPEASEVATAAEKRSFPWWLLLLLGAAVLMSGDDADERAPRPARAARRRRR